MSDLVDGAVKLRELWLATGLSITQFAEVLGEKRQRIKDVMQGRQRIPGDLVLKLPAKLPVNMQWFMGGDDEEIFLPGSQYPVPSTLTRPQRLAHALAGKLVGDVSIPAHDFFAEQDVDPDTFVFIRHYDVKGSMGIGAENDAENIKQWNAYRRSFWQKEIGLPHEECFSTDLVGVSMAPFLTERHVPIWHREDAVAMDATYFFRYQGRNYVKHLQHVPGKGLVVRSEDPAAEPWTIPDDGEDKDLKVLGRLVFKQLGEKV